MSRYTVERKRIADKSPAFKAGFDAAYTQMMHKGCNPFDPESPLYGEWLDGFNHGRMIIDHERARYE